MSTDDSTQAHAPGAESARVRSLCDEYSNAWQAGRGQPVEEFLRHRGLDPATEPGDLLGELREIAATYRPERFAPGTVLAGRYRVVMLLGKGGMGEVYRADDLTLGQPVALKFLPRHIAGDPDRLARFRQEAATARTVSHPNVCRVYDFVQHGGLSFLTMGFIDGGDLSAHLVRSRGRLTEENGLQIARELCLALGAVHAEGLLHRDLKPANVMIDGRGKVRLTDFGLAAVAAEIGANERRSGTPLYQAPEVLSGTDVTVRSDIYALGLVLYELFTGKRAFADAKRDEPPSHPSSHVSGLNPAIERVILRCLDPDPTGRPRSVADVLAALPGDLLEEAVKTGHLLSPEEVADGGEEGRLSPRVGLTLFGVALAATLLAAWLNDFVALFRQVPQDLSPRELAVRARGHLKLLGYDDHPADTAHGFATDEARLRYLRANHPEVLDRRAPRSARAALMYGFFRGSPSPLAQRLAANDTSGWSMPGRVLPNEPPLREPGMTCVFVDLNGRLLEAHAVHDPQAVEGAAIDPKVLLDAAGFPDGSLRESTEFHRVPPVFADRRMAWEGEHPDAPGVPVRVEAAFLRGKPVYFHVGFPEQTDRLPGFMPDNQMEAVQEKKNMLLGLIALPIGGWFAWVNWKGRRASPFGATVLAGAFVGFNLFGWLITAKHVPDSAAELSMFTGMLGRALFDGALLWLAYLALEPWVRRTSPWRLISWNRLLEGKWNDPLVGRDVLTGAAGAAGLVSFMLLARAVPVWFGWAPDPKLVWDATFTEGVGGLTLNIPVAEMVALRGFFLFFLIVLVCGRRPRLAAVLNVLVWAGLYQHGSASLPVNLAIGAAYAAVSFFLILRTGLLGYIAFHQVEEILIYMPVTTDLSAWYAGTSSANLAVVIGLAAYGVWAACRHRPLVPAAASIPGGDGRAGG